MKPTPFTDIRTENDSAPLNLQVRKHTKQLIASIFFNIRWGLCSMYFALCGVLAGYFVQIGRESFHLAYNMCTRGVSNDDLMLIALEMVDMVMIANLEWFIMMSSYIIFVDDRALDAFESKPAWSENLSATTQKIKIGMSLIGVSSVALLNAFMKVLNGSMPWTTVWELIALHMTITITTVAFKAFEHKHENQHKENPTHA